MGKKWKETGWGWRREDREKRETGSTTSTSSLTQQQSVCQVRCCQLACSLPHHGLPASHLWGPGVSFCYQAGNGPGISALRVPQRRDKCQNKKEQNRKYQKDLGQASWGHATSLRTTRQQSGLNISTQPKTPGPANSPGPAPRGSLGPVPEPWFPVQDPRQLAHSIPGTMCSYRDHKKR